MKKIIRTITLVSIIGLTVTSCQKEQATFPQGAAEQIGYNHTVLYSVDGISQCATFNTDEEWLEFLHQLFIWAEEGHQVNFRNAETSNNTMASKEKVVYETSNKKEAEEWAFAMEDAGYSVSVSYDSNTGIYTCIAIK
jgi:hypothetical protein